MDETITYSIKFERNPMVSAAHLSASDGSTAFVFCSIPGGRPQFQTHRDSPHVSTIVGSPQCSTHKEFVAFVKERFG